MSCKTNVINIKQGSGVVLNCVYQDVGGNALPLTGIDILVDFIDPKTGKLLFAAVIGNGITVTNETAGEYTINAGSSAGWSLGQMPLDILYEREGIPQHTEDFILDFEKGRTQVKTSILPVN